jgi:hypothetical protein
MYFRPYAQEQLEHQVQLKPVRHLEVLWYLNNSGSAENGMKF